MGKELKVGDKVIVKCKYKSLFSDWVDSLEEFKIESINENSIKGYFNISRKPQYVLKEKIVDIIQNE